MANSDTFLGFKAGYGAAGTLGSATGRGFLIQSAGLTTTEQVFQIGTDTVGTNAAAFLQIPTQSAIIGASNPIDPNANASVLLDNTGGKSGSSRGASRPYYQTDSFNGRIFILRANGLITLSTASTGTGIQIALYQSTNGATSANSIIKAVSATTVASRSDNFGVVANLMWDPTSQRINGWAEATVMGTYTIRTTVTIAGMTNIASLGFVGSILFSTATGGTVTPIEFSIDQQ